MIEFLLGLIIGVISGSLVVISLLSNHINLYTKYKNVGFDIDKLKKVIELEE